MFEYVVTMVGDMDGTDSLPDDLAERQRLLLAAFKQATQLERRVAESERQVAELNRVLGETAASYQELRQEHAATLDELAWYKRWAYGRRMDRIGEDITRELELKPATLEAHVHVRPKYACRCCKAGVCAAPLPPRNSFCRCTNSNASGSFNPR